VEDARRVWIYRAVPDCLADGRGPRDAASRIGSGGHGHVFFWASVSLAGGALRGAIRSQATLICPGRPYLTSLS